ncbi:hypothetical protein FGL74_01205 [Leuconostoc koreense]|nr:hypothetical protein FGL74_01205 [Leuconostoc mesenteroides]QGM25931.1 hypothetical protein GJV51_08045 [Leuconostoc mesenteroides subsp. mesenteroides]
MGISNVLHRRQYKITIDNSISRLDLDALSDLGIWSNPESKHYLVTLRTNDDPNTDISTFITNFVKRTGLTSDDFVIKSQTGPMTLQRAVDDEWF